MMIPNFKTQCKATEIECGIGKTMDEPKKRNRPDSSEIDPRRSQLIFDKGAKTIP